MIILLLGILGAGKTSVGTVLAHKLRYDCVELDDYILKQTPFESVSEAYEHSIAEWKQKELQATKDLSTKDMMVVVCGGAMVENNLNILHFKENAQDLKIIYLKTNPSVLTDRLISLYDEFKKSGPQSVLKKMEKYYEQRNKLYEQYADFVINTEESTPEEAAEEILARLHK